MYAAFEKNLEYLIFAKMLFQFSVLIIDNNKQAVSVTGDRNCMLSI